MAAAAAAELAAAVYEAAPPDPSSSSAAAASSLAAAAAVDTSADDKEVNVVGGSDDAPPLWSAPLATYVGADAAGRLGALLSDAARHPEAVAAALGTPAVGGVLAGEGGGAALRAWLVSAAAAGRVEVAAAAVEWLSAGTGAAADDAFDALGGAAGLADAAAAATEAGISTRPLLSST